MKSYPAYKNCDSKKIGKIPEHWSSKKLKYVSNTLPSNIDKKSKEGESIIFLCNYMDVYRNEFITDDITFMKATASDIQIEKFLLKNGDVLVTKDSEDPKDIAVPALVTKNYENVVCGYHLTRIRPKNEILGRYLFRLLQAKPFNSYFEVNAKGVTRFGLGTEAFLNFEILVPTIQEQITIANFLDHKTAQIDLSIEKGQQLIELLQEQRAAIINEAVTKGINPDVPMKDSGIEWIGEVPAHWEFTKLRYIGTFQNGISAGAEFFGSGFPFLSYGDVYKNRVIPKVLSGLVQSKKDDQERFSIKKGDVFFTRTSETIEEIGFASTCLKTVENATFAGFLIRFRPYPKILFEGYSKYFFRSHLQRLFFVGGMNLVTRASLKQDLLKEHPIFIIPIEEQILIAKHLDHATSQIDQEIQSTQKEIELLKEYRQSLIAEAVTGKVDVRDYPLN